MDTKTFSIAGVVLLVIFAIGFTVGRNNSPPKIQEKIVEKIVVQKQDNIHTVTVTVEKPSGEKTTTTTQDDKSTEVVKEDKSIDIKIDSKPDWHVAVGYSQNFGYDLYSLSVERRILGDVSVGVMGISDKGSYAAFATIGMSF